MPENLKEENVRLRRAVEELSLLNDISAAISSTMKVEDITRLIISKCIESMGVEQGAVTLTKQNNVDPFTTFVRVIDGKKEGVIYRLSTSLTGWILKNQKPLLVNELGTDSRFPAVVDEMPGTRSVLSVPLIVKDKVTGVLSLFNKIEGDFTREDQQLLSIIAIQSAQTIENARLYEEEKKLRDVEEDLKTAGSIQLALLPRENPVIPGLDIAGQYRPAREVGGDYFDFIRIDASCLGIAIADVSGKGTAAALLMANLQACLRGHVLTGSDVKDTVSILNSMLSRSIDSSKYITLFYGVVDTEEKVLSYCNAGHNPPFLLSRDGNLGRLETGGTVLGAFEDSVYEQDTIQLKPGGLLLLYTDGITEAINERGEMFGEIRVIEFLRQNRRLPASTLSRKLVDAVCCFQGSGSQTDDIALVLIKT